MSSCLFFFFSSRRRHTRFKCDWSSDVCSSDLREHEGKTLAALKKLGGKASVDQLMRETGSPDAAVMRSVLTLQEKGLIQSNEKKQTLAKLTDEGEEYAKSGLPERR